VFAAELALVALTTSLSSYWTGYALDRAGWSPRTLAFVLGVLFCVPGMLWLLVQSRWRAPAGEPEKPEEPLAPSDQTAAGDEEVLKGRIG
jgi:hypothetical protein